MSTKIPYNVLKNRPMVAGAIHTKETNVDDKNADEAIGQLTKDLGDAVGLFGGFKKDFDAHATELKNLRDKVESVGGMDAETKAAIKKQAEEMSGALAKMQACETAIESLKKEMDQPLVRGGKDLAEKDRENAIEFQKRAHLHKGGAPEEFKADLDNLINLPDVRSAMAKMMKVGIETKSAIIRSFSDAERKAFEASGLDAGFFPPELLGREEDCEIECASMLDLYDQVNVSRSTFMYPHIESYGDIGQYDCDAKCDAEYGPEGNITWKNGQTHDYRGVFCFQRDTLREANYDLLGFMMRAISRSHRINRNEALIKGDGINQPLGWLQADVFTKIQAPSSNPTHVDLRQFLASYPIERGTAQAVMHQNTFAYFASMVDSTGRFIFGDNLMGFSPDDVRDRIRVTNCLPDPTAGGTKGNAANPFTTGDFIMAAADWKQAYAAVSHRPMFMEQWEGGSSAWCVKYQFGTKDGGFIGCAPAGQVFVAGAAAAPVTP